MSPPPFTVERYVCHGCARIESERDEIRDQSTHLRFVPYKPASDPDD